MVSPCVCLFAASRAGRLGGKWFPWAAGIAAGAAAARVPGLGLRSVRNFCFAVYSPSMSLHACSLQHQGTCSIGIMQAFKQIARIIAEAILSYFTWKLAVTLKGSVQ